MRYGIVTIDTGLVVNVINLDAPPTDPTMGLGKNFQAIQNDEVNIGWTLVNGVLTDTIPPAPGQPFTPYSSLPATSLGLHSKWQINPRLTSA